MAPQLDLLKQLCTQKETFTKAQAILHVAKAKTTPGSGHELGKGSSGLPAICAHLASLQLKNDDVSEEVAQRSSCLAPRVFKTTLATVKIALKDAGDSHSRTLPTPAHRVSPKRKIEDTQTPTTPTKKRRTPYVLLSPLRSVIGVSHASSSRVTLDVLRASEDAENVPGSESEETAATMASPSKSTPSRRAGKAPGRAQDTMDVDSDSDDDESVRPRMRRFRPVFLDQKQWFSTDPRLERQWRQAEAHKEKMVEQYGHPLEAFFRSAMTMEVDE